MTGVRFAEQLILFEDKIKQLHTYFRTHDKFKEHVGALDQHFQILIQEIDNAFQHGTTTVQTVKSLLFESYAYINHLKNETFKHNLQKWTAGIVQQADRMSDSVSAKWFKQEASVGTKEILGELLVLSAEVDHKINWFNEGAIECVNELEELREGDPVTVFNHELYDGKLTPAQLVLLTSVNLHKR
jgi:hypothetical protein